ncbi:MAG: copper chaperone PCu(A)C [Gammaproteobacteria bacterium]|nr:copper chaperone PCu(A)C [Gammaproteobacteria bacterium]
MNPTPSLKHLLLLMVLACVTPGAAAATVDIPPPGPEARCPVCGMYPARFPDWVAAVRFEDDQVHYFDGPRDLFKFLNDVPRYATDRVREDVDVVAVTEHFGGRLIDAREAWFVVGSDLMGPMGHEAVAVATENAARLFMAKHGGVAVLALEAFDRRRVAHMERGELEAFVAAAEEGTAPVDTAAPGIEVTEAYIFELPPVQKNSAAYFTLVNPGANDRALVGARTPVARKAELHTHINDDGVMRMRQVDRIDVPAGGTTRLQPGGLHMMLFGLTRGLTAGDEVEIELRFDDGSTTDVVATVRKRDAGSAGHHHHDH